MLLTPSATHIIIYIFSFFKYKDIYVYTHTKYIAHISSVLFQMVKISQSQYICSNYFPNNTYVQMVLNELCINYKILNLTTTTLIWSYSTSETRKDNIVYCRMHMMPPIWSVSFRLPCAQDSLISEINM